MELSFKSAVVAVVIAFFINVVLSPLIIPILHKLKFGQNVRTDGPQSHLKKSGTPTMGGIIFIISIAVTSLFFMKGNNDLLVVLFVTLSFGLIGFLDDYIKVVKKRSMGLRAYQKIIAQLIVTTIFIYYIYQSNLDDSFTRMHIPFWGDIDIGLLWIPFVYFFVIGFVNAVNLTDGLDGLASGVTALVATFLMVIAYSYKSGIVTLSGAVVGSLMGFMLFNSHPAKIFMGDTGSLALGGFVSAAAIILKMPLMLVIVGVVYVMEAASVIIQVTYFKMTKQRFFKMAPIHHTFELSGWSETKVVTFFYVITALAALIGFLGV